MPRPEWMDYREAEEGGWANNSRGVRLKGGFGRGSSSKSLTAAQARRAREATAKIRRKKAIDRF